MKKFIALGISVAVVVGLIASGTWAVFTDTEVVEDNSFCAGTIDIRVDPTDGQYVTTVDGTLDLKPCQTGWIEINVTNDGTNPAEIWKHIANVENQENEIVDAERKFYLSEPDSEQWLLSDWIHYDISVCRDVDETIYLSDTLGADDGKSKLFEVVLDDASYRANLTPLPDLGSGAGIIPMDHADAIACTPDGSKIYCMQDNRDIGYYDLTVPSWTSLGKVTISGGANFLYIDRLAFASDGTLYFELNSGTTNALARITDLTTSPIVATVMGKVKDGGTELGLQGADIAFDSGNTCYLWHKNAAPEGVYTFPQPTTPSDISATYLGPGTTIADDYSVTGMAIRGGGAGGYPLVISDKKNDMIHEVDVVTGDMGNSYAMYEAGSPFDHANGDMTVGPLACVVLINEDEGWYLTFHPASHVPDPIIHDQGVEFNYMYLGVLQPGESMLVKQSYHLDSAVDNWGQSDKVIFDIEFVAQQIEGTLPPPPGNPLPGHGRPVPQAN